VGALRRSGREMRFGPVTRITDKEKLAPAFMGISF
jgi:hypothetical protein